ncbi:AsmA family protein [Aliivibrio logei]|uniref:AsmA family protein n=1 Tax=Aliivibrio logei 5S-186 TaxID=626086 RepID=A0ABX3APE8_ALILO|nr:AsmA family protein [Aliivibrio logei]OEF09676.1 AsmA family protein [Aliivibrio logei 5S-186]
MYTTLKSLGWLLTLCLLLVAAFLSLLHTPYAQPLLNPVVEKLTHQTLSFGGISYSIHDPLHLTISDIVIHSEPELPIQQIDLWLSKHPIQNNKLAFDSVKIDGISLQNGLPNTKKLNWFSISQLSISNLDFAEDGLVVREAQIQLSNYDVHNEKGLPFKGEFQLSTQQLYWQGEALDDVLIDGYYTENYTALQGISLTWRNSTITAQAELKENKLWVIPQFTLRKFNLESDNADIIGKPLQWLSEQGFTYQFERIDLLDVNIELPQFSVNDLSLSAENILLPYKIWQQNDANISFSADSLVWKDTIINKPIIELTLTNKKATISNLSLDVFNGNIQLSGLLSPTTINLSSLTLNQIKWLISPQELDSISNYLTQLEQVKIANLDINNSQIIQLETAHPFQLSGLNVEGHDLDLLRYYQWALWDGKLSISASNASLNYLLTQQLLIETNTNNGLWTIERALFPLTEGLIGLNGSINLKQDSQPWQLEAYGDGIPLSDLAKWLPNPIPLEGMAEFTFSGNGLAVNKDSFNYSFDGDLNVIPRETTTTETAKDLWQLKLGLIPDESQSEKDVSAQTQRKKEHTMDKKTIYPINIEPIHISANRGRISINPIMITGDGFNYNVEGEYDLVNPEKAETVISLTQECHQIVQRLFSDKVDLINYCQ